MSSVITPRERSTSYSASPKSSPTGPTTRVSAKNEEASEKCTAEPPSRRSRDPCRVSTASNAMEPTTVSVIRAVRLAFAPVRALRIAQGGGPEVLEYVEDADEPVAGDGELLVRVSRAGVNFADTHAREDVYVDRYALPMIPGAEVAGTVEGDGRRVVALTGGAGGYAELAAGPAESAFDIPDGVSDAVALGLLIQGLTAWHLYRTSAKLAEGESVVVHSAAGGVGSLALQLARPMGAGRVIATASSEDKRALATELGADAVVDSAPENMSERLLEATDGRPVDVVF